MAEVKRYRKKPVEIEAVQFDGDNRRQVLSFIYPTMSEDGLRGAEVMALPIVIPTLEGDMNVSVGDWVIRGIKGEYYPCKPDIFEASYDVVSRQDPRCPPPPDAADPAPEPFPRQPDCHRCNYDNHRCPGCGEPLPHGTEVCEPCNEIPTSTEV